MIDIIKFYYSEKTKTLNTISLFLFHGPVAQPGLEQRSYMATIHFGLLML